MPTEQESFGAALVLALRLLYGCVVFQTYLFRTKFRHWIFMNISSLMLHDRSEHETSEIFQRKRFLRDGRGSNPSNSVDSKRYQTVQKLTKCLVLKATFVATLDWRPLFFGISEVP